MWTAFPSSDYYADSATPRAQQPASGLAEPPMARRVRGASHVHRAPFDRVGSRLYPCSASGEQSQHLPRPPSPRGLGATCRLQGRGRCCTQPMSARFGAGVRMKGLLPPLAFALPFGLACTRAGVWQYRPAVTLSGLLPPLVRDPAPRLPPASPDRCISPGPASQPARIEMSFALIHLLSHSASWRTEEIASDDPARLRS
jgi:hypothetical protein